MNIKKKIIIASFAKLLFINNYDIAKVARAMGVKKDSQLLSLFEEIKSIDFHYEEILYVLNNFTSLSGQSIADITDYSNTHISIQKTHADNARLEKKIETFNGMPLYGDEWYKKLFKLILSHDEIWNQVHRTLFQKMDLNGRFDDLEVEQPDNFLDASREIVGWVLLDSLSRFKVSSKDKEIKLGLVRSLYSVHDDSIQLDIKMLNSIFEKFQTKPRFKPTWKEATIAFSFMGFKTKALNHSYWTIANLKDTVYKKGMGKGAVSLRQIWIKERIVLTQVFDQTEIISQLYKFLVAMNRIKTKGNKYTKKFSNSINMLRITMESE